jgi:hypothetical protein
MLKNRDDGEKSWRASVKMQMWLRGVILGEYEQMEITKTAQKDQGLFDLSLKHPLCNHHLRYLFSKELPSNSIFYHWTMFSILCIIASYTSDIYLILTVDFSDTDGRFQ